jgi:YidC/Oxa1 family membrane protein insertase
VVRPHPEFIKRRGEKVTELQEKYKGHRNFFLETNSASSQNIQESALLITDWSGIGIEFAWGMIKPVIYIDTLKKVHNPEYEKIGILPLEVRLRNLIGTVIKLSDCSCIDSEVEEALSRKEENKEALIKLRNENIFNWGRSSEVGAEYIMQYCKQKWSKNENILQVTDGK